MVNSGHWWGGQAPWDTDRESERRVSQWGGPHVRACLPLWPQARLLRVSAAEGPGPAVSSGPFLRSRLACAQTPPSLPEAAAMLLGPSQARGAGPGQAERAVEGPGPCPLPARRAGLCRPPAALTGLRGAQPPLSGTFCLFLRPPTAGSISSQPPARLGLGQPSLFCGHGRGALQVVDLPWRRVPVTHLWPRHRHHLTVLVPVSARRSGKCQCPHPYARSSVG